MECSGTILFIVGTVSGAEEKEKFALKDKRDVIMLSQTGKQCTVAPNSVHIAILSAIV